MQAIEGEQMPAPSIIVYITDADGDEFPIRLWGHYDPALRAATVLQALEKLEGYVKRGEMRPTYPVTVPRIEQV